MRAILDMLADGKNFTHATLTIPSLT